MAAHKPRTAQNFLIGILVLGGLLAVTVPKSVTGKFYMMIVVVVAGLCVFVALFVRAQREREEREKDHLLEIMRQHAAGGAPKPAARPAPPMPAPATGKHEWTLELLQRLEPRRFETMCAAYFKALGFRVVAAGLGSDGGAEIRLHAGTAPKPTHAVQCRAGNHAPVGVKQIRELAGALHLEDVAEGIFVTAGVFSAEARQLAARSARKLHLLEGQQLLEKLKALEAPKAQALLRLVTA